MSESKPTPNLPPLQCADPSLPHPVPASAARWLQRAVIALALAIVVALAFYYDLALMRWRNANVSFEPDTALEHWVDGFRTFGTSFSVVLAMAIVGICDRRRITILLTLIAAQVLASAGYNTSKHLVVRYRPYEIAAQNPNLENVSAADLWDGWQTPPRRFALESFPSGHSAAAFALATILAWFYPRLRIPLFILAGGCALSRFIEARHWMSDILCGGILGYLCAWLSLRAHWIYSLLPLRTLKP